MGYDATKKAIEGSFAQTGLEYIDLYILPPMPARGYVAFVLTDSTDI